VCFDRGAPQIITTADRDLTDDRRYCVRADALELGAKLAYYGAKLLKLASAAPVPPPP
jgi:hypothetical protein